MLLSVLLFFTQWELAPCMYWKEQIVARLVCRQTPNILLFFRQEKNGEGMKPQEMKETQGC